jgi:hypothetical protein
MTASELIAVLPWIAFGIGLLTVLVLLRRSRRTGGR